MPEADDIVAGENKSSIFLIGDEKCNREGDCGVDSCDSDAELNREGGVSGSVLVTLAPDWLFDDEIGGTCDGKEEKPY